MKPLTKFLAAALVLSAISTAVVAGDEEITTGGVAMENSSTSAAFANVKKKLEKLEGQMKQAQRGDVFDVSSEWRLVAGGNTFTETVVEDVMEMLSTYSD